MRSTWFGARSGRNAITTRPLVVSSTRVFSGSAAMAGSSGLAVVDEAEGERTPGDGGSERGGERQRRALREGGHDGCREALLEVPLATSLEVGDLRLSKHFAGALEAQPHRHLQARRPLARGRRAPAGANRREHVADALEPPDIGNRARAANRAV